MPTTLADPHLTDTTGIDRALLALTNVSNPKLHQKGNPFLEQVQSGRKWNRATETVGEGQSDYRGNGQGMLR